MVLINKQTGKEVKKGDTIYFERSKATVKLIWLSPPHKVSSQGKITVKSNSGFTQEYYPSVFGCKYVKKEETKDCFFVLTTTQQFNITMPITKAQEKELREDPELAMSFWELHNPKSNLHHDHAMTTTDVISEVSIENSKYANGLEEL